MSVTQHTCVVSQVFFSHSKELGIKSRAWWQAPLRIRRSHYPVCVLSNNIIASGSMLEIMLPQRTRKGTHVVKTQLNIFLPVNKD